LRIAALESFQSKILNLIWPALGWPLLAGGYFSEVAVYTGLTGLTGLTVVPIIYSLLVTAKFLLLTICFVGFLNRWKLDWNDGNASEK
jgi:hypothetical protein